MKTAASIKGLFPGEWRVVDGAVQRREKKVILTGDTYDADPFVVAGNIQEFATGRRDVKIEIEHDREYSDMYSCETKLEVTGWRPVDDDELKKARDSARAQLRTRELQIERQLREQQERLEAELEAVRRRRDSV